jgi:opacity protein-like surface antigen
MDMKRLLLGVGLAALCAGASQAQNYAVGDSVTSRCDITTNAIED